MKALTTKDLKFLEKKYSALRRAKLKEIANDAKREDYFDTLGMETMNHYDSMAAAFRSLIGYMMNENQSLEDV